MTEKNIVSDFNGTLIEPETEKPLLEHIAFELKDDALPENKNYINDFPLRPLIALKLLWSKHKIYKLYEEFNEGWEDQQEKTGELFEVYNRNVIKDVPLEFVKNSISRYVTRFENGKELDEELLEEINQAKESGAKTGILSAGFSYGIEQILKTNNYLESFDFIEANEFETGSQKIKKLKRDNLKTEIQKSDDETEIEELFKQLYDRYDIDENSIYLGDRAVDETFFDAFEYPAVPPFVYRKWKNGDREKADGYKEFMERAADNYGAEILKEGSELEKLF